MSYTDVRFSKIHDGHFFLLKEKKYPEDRSPKTLLQTQLSYLITSLYFLLRKEVIHPHVPVGIPCYDLTPVIGPALDDSLPCGLCHRLRALPASMV